jgi:hypothetical protein
MTDFVALACAARIQHLAWVGFNTAIAATLCPLGVLGGPLLVKAAMATGCVVGALSLIAATAPSDQFLKMGGGLSVGLGCLLAASVGMCNALHCAAMHWVLTDMVVAFDRSNVLPGIGLAVQCGALWWRWLVWSAAVARHTKSSIRSQVHSPEPTGPNQFVDGHLLGHYQLVCANGTNSCQLQQPPSLNSYC